LAARCSAALSRGLSQRKRSSRELGAVYLRRLESQRKCEFSEWPPSGFAAITLAGDIGHREFFLDVDLTDYFAQSIADLVLDCIRRD